MIAIQEIDFWINLQNLVFFLRYLFKWFRKKHMTSQLRLRKAGSWMYLQVSSLIIPKSQQKLVFNLLTSSNISEYHMYMRKKNVILKIYNHQFEGKREKRRERSYPKCNERFTEEVINQNLQKLARNQCRNLKWVRQRLAELTALAAKLRKHDTTGNLKVKHFEDFFWMWFSKIFKNSKSPSGS